MNTYADLEIGIHQRSAGKYTVEARFSPAGSEADIRIGEQEEIEIQFDFEALQKNALALNMESYGRLLTASLFSPSQAKEFFARAVSDAGDEPLRLRLLFGPTAGALHSLYWETLRNPVDGTLLAANENILFSRYLASEAWKGAHPRPKKKVKALVAVSNPSDLADYQLAAVNVSGELERAQGSLRDIELKSLPDDLEKCTLENLTAHMRDGYDILYLVAHGRVDRDGNPWLFLESQKGTVERVSGQKIADHIRGMRTPPLLVILASCESAGEGNGRTLQALGPLLSSAGVPAVIAMQGEISIDSVSRMMPVFFRELQKDGMVDRALAVARSTLLAAGDYDVWVPTLFLRLKSGVIWQDGAEEAQRKETIRATKRIWQTQWFVFTILFLAILGVGAGLYFGLRPKEKPVMTGEFRIAIASFDEHGKSLPDKIGYTIADGINLRISDELKEITVGPKAEIWGPERIGTISGKTDQERTENAAKLAKEIQAYMVIYGVVEET
ncbi:MAG: CHAT domain-containing protein, partial [Anaerolineales bacterium]